MVMVDNLTKEAHFIPVNSIYKTDAIAKIFKKDIFKLHGFPKEIVSDKDPKFTSNFRKGLFSYLGTKMKFNIAYHPQIDGQTERVNPVLEDMVRMYVMGKLTKWEDYLHLVEFSYNNG